MPRLTPSNLRLILYVLAVLVVAAGCTPTPTPAPTDTPSNGIPAALLEAPDTSGNVWIEFPYEGQTLPNEPLTLIVYAASAGGVDGIGLSVNDVGLIGGSFEDHSIDGDGSLMSLEQTWHPPGPGTYVLAASSVGVNSAIEFCIESCDTPVLEEHPTSSPTPTAWVSATPTPTVYQPGTPTPTAYIEPNTPTPTTYAAETYMDFGADPMEMAAGSCTTLYWTTEGYASVTLNSNSVPASGTDEECLCNANTYTLTGTTAGGAVESDTVTVSITGSCETADTTPPAVSWTDIRWDDCKFYGSAQINDDSGTVSWAKFHYNLNGSGWNSVWMQDLGGGVWESEVGVQVSDGMSTPAGSFLYRVEAADEAGNPVTMDGPEVSYTSCSG